ncbi:hypothetical protein K439DRAFT_1638368 [Ramaria rubella]|nr:hypothetical protein K439DRAFT_1638368 [Ramaria rubella]
MAPMSIPLMPTARVARHSLPYLALFTLLFTLHGILSLDLSEITKPTTSLILENLVLGSDRHGQCSSKCSVDPFTRPGMLIRGPNGSDTRWVPFPSQVTHTLPSLNALTIDYNAPIPENALRLACPQYMKMLSESNGSFEMDWVKNKTVLFIGSSHDRNNIEYFCDTLKGNYTSIGGHTAGSCNITTHNLVLAFWFTYGAADSETYDWFSPLELRPVTFEHKVEEVMVPWMIQQGISDPDLIIETSLYWDDAFFNQLAVQRNSTLVNQPLTYSELSWHRSRIRELVAYTRALYGEEIPIMFRTRHFRESNRWNRIMRIFQLDQNLRAVARELDIKLFRWGDLLEGITSFYDGDQHFKRGPVTWLFGDMTLFYLRQATTSGCWACYDEL